MNTNKILLGGIAGGVAFFLLGWLIYGILLKDFMAANGNQSVMRPMEEMIWWAMIVSNIVSGLMIAMIFTWANTTSVAAGAKIGAIVGLLMAISIDLSFYSMSTIFSSLTGVFVDVVASTIMITIGAAVIAWAMGLVKK